MRLIFMHNSIHKNIFTAKITQTTVVLFCIHMFTYYALVGKAPEAYGSHCVCVCMCVIL